MKNTLDELADQVLDFRDRRDWSQFHHPKELASALAIEVAEVMELFRFKSPQQVATELEDGEFKEKLGDELADSLFLLLLLAKDSQIDLKSAFDRKLKLLEERYPEDESRGRNEKWTSYLE